MIMDISPKANTISKYHIKFFSNHKLIISIIFSLSLIRANDVYVTNWSLLILHHCTWLIFLIAINTCLKKLNKNYNIKQWTYNARKNEGKNLTVSNQVPSVIHTIQFCDLKNEEFVWPYCIIIGFFLRRYPFTKSSASVAFSTSIRKENQVWKIH